MERSRKSYVPSSRLSELPQRVADSNRMSMAYATPQSKSFGKLNIPKPPSVSSDRRTSFFGSRTSGAGMARNSIFGGAEKIKDVRPLHDKTFVQQCIRQLCEFLQEKGFPGAVTTKSLQSPSTKEFLKVFEFIYCLLDPTFHMPSSKVEEEVPRILKDLGYQFALSKSSMYSVGAPHTWPQVLGALVWLIDNVKIYCAMEEQQDLLFSDFSEGSMEIEDGVEYNKLFLDYCSETYSMFMQGADTFDSEDEEFLSKMKKLYNVDETVLASMEARYRMVTEEVDRLERDSQADRLMGKRTEKLKLQTDLQKLQSYHSNLETFKGSLEGKAAMLAEELQAAGLQTESLKQQQARLQLVLQQQKFTPADIERINREKRELQQSLSSLSTTLDQAQQQMWSEEINLAKAKEAAEMKLAEYHKLARQLKLIPASAENACGHDFTISPCTEQGPSSLVHYKTHIQVALRKLIINVEEESSRLTNKKLTLEGAVDQVNSCISDKGNDLKQLREQIRRLDEKLENDSQELARDEQKWAAEMESVDNHKKLLEKNITQGYEESVEQLKAARQQYHLVRQETDEQRRTVAKNLASVFSTATDHLGIVEKYLEDQRKRVERVCSETLQEEEEELQNLHHIMDGFLDKAANMPS
ncbi:LOW QUALITY PROTEIN: kinetochore protein NDC80 homolog [Osmerus mordax]|uniref:LOW QUALITY PROTEIN: kinetochore protein NDC80 homolog n=1 Tax=Osmerus mordax TaxID=8014 RepID=UPI00350F6C64